MHGVGKLFFGDGSRYEGVWEKNNVYGRGEMIFWDGKVERIHRGEWIDNKFKVTEML